MTRYFLTRIKIEGFRGINNESDPLELNFKPDSVNSVFGVNGVGKSSIFEALNYAIRGTVSKLEVLQAHERPNDYICNRFHSVGTATIELEFKPDDGAANITIEVQRDASGARTVTSPTGYADPEGLLKSLDEDFTLLDYQRFSEFIDSTPLDRGRSFSALLGQSKYSDFRQVLQKVSDTRAFNTDFDIITTSTEAKALDEATQAALCRLKISYRGLTGKEITDVSAAKVDDYTTEVLTALSGINLIKENIDGKTLDQIDFTAVKNVIKKAEEGEQRRELGKTIEEIAELSGLIEADTSSFEAEQVEMRKLLLEKEELVKLTRGNTFQSLYDTAKILIDDGEWEHPNKCPLCESELKGTLHEVVEKQLEQYDQVLAVRRKFNEAWQSASWCRRLQVLENTKPLGVADEDKKSGLLIRKFDAGELTLTDVESAFVALAELDTKLSDALSSAKSRKDELEKKLPPSLVSLVENVEYGSQFKEARKEFLDSSTRHDALVSRLRKLSHWQGFITRAAAVFAEAEADLSSRRISLIEAEYKGLFSEIMMDSAIEPKLQRADRSEGLNVQLSDFHGQSNVSARALLSESYRNALAISVFLSAALRHSGVPRFIILDDVTSSFDSGHQFKIMEVIRCSLQHPRNTKGLQFILLSHDGLLEKYFNSHGNTSDWHHQVLQGLPPMSAVMSNLQDAQRLRDTAICLLDAGQVKEAEPFVRPYLEFKLIQIIRKVGIPVPLDFAIKDSTRVVSNCLEAIRSAIELHKKASTLIDLPPKKWTHS